MSLLTTLQLRNCSRNLGYLFKVVSWGSSGSLGGWVNDSANHRLPRADLGHPQARPLD